MTVDAHCDLFRHACPYHITDTRPTKVVRSHALVFFPFVTLRRNHFGDLAESRRNACLLKFLAEVRCVEHWRIVLAELLFERVDNFIRKRESLSVAGLGGFIGNLDDATFRSTHDHLISFAAVVRLTSSYKKSAYALR